MVNSKGCVMPGVPAVPKNRAYSDHSERRQGAERDERVHRAAPWRRLVHAARWNGQAAHTTTGAARVSDTHCQ